MAFEKFAKVNERLYRKVRDKPRIMSQEDLMAQDDHTLDMEAKFGGDVYNENVIDQMEDDGIMESQEAAFMRGYIGA